MREKYTALCPEPVIRATLVSSDSLSTTPTSPWAREEVRQIRTKASKKSDENKRPAMGSSRGALAEAGTAVDVWLEDEMRNSKTVSLIVR
jgi:hypothetical protein